MEMFEYPDHVYNTKSAEFIFPLIDKKIGPFSSILDIGCGNGSWLSAFKSSKPELEIFGVDYEEYGSRMKIEPVEYQHVDLSKPVDLNRIYDLVISLEVAEHLPEHSADIFVASLAKHGDIVLFSAAIPGQGGVNHLNEQWQSYWSRKFEGHGFKPFDIRSLIWKESDVDFWYRQNIVLYSRQPLNLSPHSIETIDVIHPEMWRHKKTYPESYLMDIYEGNIGVSNSFRLLFRSLKKRLFK